MDSEPDTIPGVKAASYAVILLSVSFAIPFLITGPQLLTGTLVNTLLFLSSKYISGRNRLAMALLPSIGAVLNGVVFGGFTRYLLFFLPFIWAGNLILIYSFSRYKNILISSVLKSILLFLTAYIFTRFSLVPNMFLTAMGIFQLITAVLGGTTFLIINKLIKKNLKF